MKALLVGYGEIGQAVREVFRPAAEQIAACDPARGYPEPDAPFDLLLVAIPYSESFVATVNGYRERHGCRATIIFSTVAIGTTRQIPGAVHSPIEGRHPHLAHSIRVMPRWVGGRSDLAEEFMARALGERRIYRTREPEWTEFLKLRSTSRYGAAVEFVRYEAAVAAAIGMDYRLVQDFDRDYNALYRSLGLDNLQRYILTPPEGNTGGHCIVPNARILDAQFPHPFLAEIIRDKEAAPCSPEPR